MKGASGALSRNVKLVKTKKEGISTFKKLVTKVSISYRLIFIVIFILSGYFQKALCIKNKQTYIYRYTGICIPITTPVVVIRQT